MAFDGIVIRNLQNELSTCLVDGRIQKIYQPEKDEIHLLIKNQRQTYRLLLSASASLPLVYLAQKPKTNPMTAPNFCMLLRKYIQNGKILSVEQPGMERILIFNIEHTDELGDLCTKKLIIEIMGKHSNLIFTDASMQIIDSMKHISQQISSVREILPGRTYHLPPDQGKACFIDLSKEQWVEKIFFSPLPLSKAIYTSFQGISPVMAREFCYQAQIDSKKKGLDCSSAEQNRLLQVLENASREISLGKFSPSILFQGNEPVEFSSLPMTMYEDDRTKIFPTISQVLEEYYAKKEISTRIHQKSSDLRRIVITALERSQKKYDLQMSQLEDTKKRETYRIYGEMLHTYGYSVKPGEKSLTCINYYDNQEITIPLTPELTAMENAQKYFNRYNKLKRTFEALSELTIETKKQIHHLESILTALDLSTTEADLSDIKEELIEYGYMKRKGGKKGKKGREEKSKPLHFISSDGFHMYVGKNNYQNEELTFKFATGKDMWFHAKGMAGSHVIVKVESAGELPDSTYEEAGRLAAYYSKGRQAKKVEIDYTERRNLKKTPASAPGFVIYHTNYSLLIEPDITGIQEL
ncbi:MAG: NFACT family protein [Lachnospiraceae bacterium]|nr:NFACT family protein [Lachnospiraceae bacterium]